jgi:hypothetical protein
MFDLSKPIPMEVVVVSMVFLVVLVGIGLAIVAYYKKKLEK